MYVISSICLMTAYTACVLYMCIYIYIYSHKIAKCVYITGQLKRHLFFYFFSYKYFGVFTKSSTLYKDQVF